MCYNKEREKKSILQESISIYFFLKTAVAVTPFNSISTFMTSAVTVLLMTVLTPCLHDACNIVIALHNFYYVLKEKGEAGFAIQSPAL